MAMKKEDKVLTYEQAREMKWFCQNVVGLKHEYYEIMDKANGFQGKIDRLMKTCEVIENFLKIHGEKFDQSVPASGFFNKTVEEKQAEDKL